MISSLGPTTTRGVYAARSSTALALMAVWELIFKQISIGAVWATNLLVLWLHL